MEIRYTGLRYNKPVKDAQNLTDIDELLASLPDSYGLAERDLVQRAYRLAEEAHRDQKRLSGEPYINHCVSVASILADLDSPALCINSVADHAHLLFNDRST